MQGARRGVAGLTLFALGLATGGYGTLIGAGGGFLLVPLLLFLDPTLPATTVTSISLTVIALNALSGSLAYARLHRIDYHVAIALAATNVPAAMLGAALTAFVPRTAFELTLGVVLLGLAVFLLVRPLPRATPGSAGFGGPPPAASGGPPPVGSGAVPAPPASGRFSAGMIASAVVGVVAGLLGIGGSPLQVVVLTHLMDVPVRTAMPTSQFMVLLASVGGVLIHLGTGHFDFDLRPLVLLGAGALVGAQGGALLSTRISGVGLVRLMALALVIIGMRLVVAPLR